MNAAIIGLIVLAIAFFMMSGGGSSTSAALATDSKMGAETKTTETFPDRVPSSQYSDMVGVYQIADSKKCQQIIEQRIKDDNRPVNPFEYVDFQFDAKISVLPDDNFILSGSTSAKTTPKFTAWTNNQDSTNTQTNIAFIPKEELPKTASADAKFDSGCVPFVVYNGGHVDIDVDKLKIPSKFVFNGVNMPLEDSKNVQIPESPTDIANVLKTDGKTLKINDPYGQLPSECQLKRVSTSVPKTCTSKTPSLDLSIMLDGKPLDIAKELKARGFSI